MSVIDKLKRAGAWQLFQVLSQVFIQFFYVAIMARLLNKDDFGLMAIATAFIALGMVFGMGGLGSALIQRKCITQNHMNAAFQGSLILGVAVFFILYASSGLIARFYNDARLEQIIQVVGLGVILNSAGSVSRSLLEKAYSFKKTANITVAATLMGCLVGIASAFSGLGVWALVWSSITMSLITTIAMFCYAPIKISLKFHYGEFKELFSYGFGIVLLGLSNYLANGGLNLILGKVFSPSMLGVFERTYIIKNLPSQFLGNVLGTIMFPAMSELNGNEEKLFRVYQYSLGTVNSILMPLAVFLIMFSKEIVLILLGEEWLEAVVPLQIMFLVLPFSTSGRLADTLIRARGYVYKNVVRKLVYAVVLIVSTASGAKFYGLSGAALAVVFSYLFNYCLMLFLIRDIFNKSLAEIFLQPILSGLKLSIMVLTLILIVSMLLSGWFESSLLKFFLTASIVAGALLLVGRFKPALLGLYLHETLKRVLSGKK